MPTTPLRIVQWATGNIGTRSLQLVIDDANLQLAGLVVHDSDKVGRDVGELAAAPPATWSPPSGIVTHGDLPRVLPLLT